MGRSAFAHGLFKTQAKTRSQQKTNASIQRNAITAAIGLRITGTTEPVVPIPPVVIDPVPASVSVSVKGQEIVRCSVKKRQIVVGPVRWGRWKARAGIGLGNGQNKEN
jgi:hypothetical protein